MSSTEPTNKSIGVALEAAVFVCGAAVMIFEINGSRILAPFLGTSTYIWTSLIGVILAALSIGYWAGGKLADSKPSAAVLALIIFLSGGLVSITILIKDVVLAFIGTIPAGLEVKSLAAAIILFAPASVAFGFVLPFAAKLRIGSLNTSGSTVGRLYALSTIGSILGTFMAGFILIPFVGSVRTLYLIAIALFLVSLLLAPFTFSRLKIGAVVIFALAVIANESLNAYQRSKSNYYDIDTEYSRLAVFDTVEPGSDRAIRVIANDPYFAQSAMYLDSDELVFKYNRAFYLAEAFASKMERCLMIGGGAFSFPRDFIRSYPGSAIDVVEIDPGMTRIAREHFRLSDMAGISVFHEDARIFVNRSDPSLYNVVFMDAFGTLFSVPYHLTTVEFMKQIKHTLTEEGILVMNLGGALTGNGSGFLRSEITTLRSVFPSVRVFKVDPSRKDSDLQNLIIVASKTYSEPVIVKGRPFQSLLANEYTETVPTELEILTDDLAPVEYYNSFALNQHQIDRNN